MDYEKLNRVELSRLLVGKHENFIEEYGKEFELLQRAYVLKEKLDQLEYWLDESKDDPKKNLEYKKAAELSQNELIQVNEEIKVLYDKPRRNFGPAPSERPARFKWLTEQLALHAESRDYWSNKIIELEEKEKRAKEEAVDEKKSRENSKDKDKKGIKSKSKTKKTVKEAKKTKTKKTAKPKTKDEGSSAAEKVSKKSAKPKTGSEDTKKAVKEKEKKTAKKSSAK